MWRFVCSSLLLAHFYNYNNGVTAKTITTVVVAKKVDCFVRDSSIMKQFNCSLDTKTSLLNQDIIYERDIDDYKYVLKFFLDIYGKKTNFYSTEFYYCASLSSRKEHFIVEYMLKEIGRTANLVEGCPFKKHKLYYLRDFNISLVKAQSYWPVLNWFLELEFYIENKLAYGLHMTGATAKISSA